jgi:hypothetical protein
MNVNTEYSISLLVESTDGRSAETVRQIGATRAFVGIAEVSRSRRFNEDEKVFVLSSVLANDDIVATWTVLQDSVEVSPVFRTEKSKVFQSATVLSSVEFAVVVAGSSLDGNVKYEFRLTVCSLKDAELCSSGASIITFNAPPTSGSMAVSPTSGFALETEYFINAFDWNDDVSDFPLYYVFTTQSYPTAPQLTVSSKSRINSVTTSLSVGLPSRDYAVTITTRVIDNFDCSANISKIVQVQLPTNADVLSQITNLSSSVSGQLQDFEKTQDPDAVFRYIGGVSSILNIRNCSASPNCTTLHRQPCADTPNT